MLKNTSDFNEATISHNDKESYEYHNSGSAISENRRRKLERSDELLTLSLAFWFHF